MDSLPGPHRPAHNPAPRLRARHPLQLHRGEPLQLPRPVQTRLPL